MLGINRSTTNTNILATNKRQNEQGYCLRSQLNTEKAWRDTRGTKGKEGLLSSKQNAKKKIRFQKLPAKTTKISHLLKEKIDKFGV